MSKKSIRPGFSIRTKLTLVALLLLLIPWMSYIYVRDMKGFLIKGQENALSLTARAVSTVLHDRPELFAKTNKDELEDSTQDIFVAPLANYIKIDGVKDDWGEHLANLKLIDKISPVSELSPPEPTDIKAVTNQVPIDPAEPNNDAITSPTPASNDQAKVLSLLAYRGNFLYALFVVEDNEVVFRGQKFLRTDASDHLRLTIQSPTNFVSRYAVTAREPGVMSAYRVDKEWTYPIDGKPISALLAHIEPTEKGYTLEIRIPRYMISQESRMQLSVVDVDSSISSTPDEDGNFKTVYNTQGEYLSTPSNDDDQFSRLLLQTPEIDKILKGLNRSDTRIWVLDNKKSVRTVVGNLSSGEVQIANEPDTITGKIKFKYKQLLSYIFNIILKQPSQPFDNKNIDSETRDQQVLDLALSGQSLSDRRTTSDNSAEIIMAANPIWSGNQVIGAVVVEQSSGEVLAKQREALENVISVTLITLVVVLTTILFFASRLTLRIRRLRNAAEQAIDRHGKIIAPELKADARSGDEVGDLSRSISGMLNRLSQYTNYLKGLPDTLSHEVSNPLNVVNSSLHNLRSEHPSVSESKYLQRAEKGLNRIRKILTNLTEAANLEQAMQTEEMVNFNLNQLVSSYVEGYQQSNPSQYFELKSIGKNMSIKGEPDHIAQMLDKLIDNAMDFCAPDQPVIVRLRRDDSYALIDVINEGSTLPNKMHERIFEPMVSLGRKDAQKTRLGMGLYVVKLIANFHGGDVIARNLNTRKGVIFTVSLPLDEELEIYSRTPPKF